MPATIILPRSPLEAALAYVAKGYGLVRIVYGGKEPTDASWQRGERNQGVVESWFRDGDVNIGIVCDASFGWALDIDDQRVVSFLASKGYHLPTTLTARTPSGGLHYVFQHPTDWMVRCTIDGAPFQRLKAMGYVPTPDQHTIDTRGMPGGQIVVAPSVRKGGKFDGEIYEWLVDAPIAPAPEWLLDLVRPGPAKPGPVDVDEVIDASAARALTAAEDTELKRIVSPVFELPEGRYTAIHEAAIECGRKGLPFEAVARALNGAAEANGYAEKDARGAARQVRRGWAYGAAQAAETAKNLSQADALRAKMGLTPRPNPVDLVWAKTSGKKGEPVTCLENTEILLDHHGALVKYNLMSHRNECLIETQVVAERQNNAGLAHIREWARWHGLSDGKPLEDHIEILSTRNVYHPVAEWASSPRWDGRDRFGDLVASLEIDPEWTTQFPGLARKLIVAWMVTGGAMLLVSGERAEGVNAQSMLVLQGDQARRKTRWIKSLLPDNRGWFAESVMLDPSSKDSVQKATSFFLVELGELDATFRKADIAALKAFVTSSKDVIRTAWDRREETLPRRTLFAASVNGKEFLADETGNRRFGTIPVINCNPDHGIDLQQLWAQALHIAETNPEARFLDAETESLVNQSNEAFQVVDPVEETVLRVWELDPTEKSWVSLDEIKRACDPGKSWNAHEVRQLSKVLKERLKAKSRKVKGYRQYAVKKQPQSESPGSRG